MVHNRGPALASIAMLAALALITLNLPASGGSAEASKEEARRSGEGIWKAVVPPGRVPSEFDAYDPIGLAAGAIIKADCSINWRDPDTGKRYCFASGTSLNHFLAWPRKNIRRATEAWERVSIPVN